MTTPNQIVSISIDASSKSLDRPGFGLPLIAAYHSRFAERTREYTDLEGMVDDGFAVTDPAYLCASMVCSQDPKPASFKIGRRALPPTQTITIKALDATEGTVYSFKIGPKGAETQITYTVLASATTTTVATALELLVEAVTDVASTSSTDTVTAVVTAGTLLNVIDTTPARSPRVMQINDTTADPGIATDLAAIQQVDNAWYGLLLDSNSKAEIVAAAAWVEAADKLFGYHTADAACSAGTAGNVGLTLKASAYKRTFGIFTRAGGTLSYGAAGWMAGQFPNTPGSTNWADKQIAGLPVDTLSATETTNLVTANLQTYETVFGQGVTVGRSDVGGKVASGEWIDNVWGLDALSSNIQVSLIALKLNNKKLAMTNIGIGAVQSTVLAELMAFASDNGQSLLLAFPKPVVYVPDASAISSADKASRRLGDIKFRAYLSAGINGFEVQGTVTY